MNYKNTLLMVLCGVGILVSGCSKSPKPKPGSLTLQGTWNAVSGRINGTDHDLSSAQSFLIIEGANFQDLEGKSLTKGTFSLREDTTPKQLEAVITECSTPDLVGKTVHAIYKIEESKDGRFTLLTFTENQPGNPDVPDSFDAAGATKIVSKKYK